MSARTPRTPYRDELSEPEIGTPSSFGSYSKVMPDNSDQRSYALFTTGNQDFCERSLVLGSEDEVPTRLSKNEIRSLGSRRVVPSSSVSVGSVVPSGTMPQVSVTGDPSDVEPWLAVRPHRPLTRNAAMPPPSSGSRPPWSMRGPSSEGPVIRAQGAPDKQAKQPQAA